jgi:hypothetical protein
MLMVSVPHRKVCDPQPGEAEIGVYNNINADKEAIVNRRIYSPLKIWGWRLGRYSTHFSLQPRMLNLKHARLEQKRRINADLSVAIRRIHEIRGGFTVPMSSVLI